MQKQNVKALSPQIKKQLIKEAEIDAKALYGEACTPKHAEEIFVELVSSEREHIAQHGHPARF